jgi:hypothetical protein
VGDVAGTRRTLAADRLVDILTVAAVILSSV